MWKLVPVVTISLVFAFLSDMFSRKDPMKNKYVYHEKILWIGIIIVMSVFAGLRVGYNDTRTYLDTYVYLTNDTMDFSPYDWTIGNSPGYLLVNLLLKYFGFSENGYLMLFAMITYFIYIWFIYKYSTDFLMSIFLFICLVFTFPLAAIRQSIAVAFCLVAVDKAINKRWFWFAFWLFIAEMFHAYSFMYLIVPMMFFVPWESKKTFVWIIIFFFAGLLLKPMLGTILSITESFGKNYTVEEFSGEGVNPFRLAVSLVPLVLSFILRKKIPDPRYEFTFAEGLFMNLSLLNGEIMFVALFGTANYFARLANYFYIFPIISLPRMFNMVETKWRMPMKVAAIVCYFMFFYYSNIYAGWNSFDIEFAGIAPKEFHWFA